MSSISCRSTQLYILGLVALVLLILTVACGQPRPTPTSPINPTIASLMGDQKRDALAARIAATRIPWSTYAAWGKQLMEQGSVTNPPVGPVPSPKLSNAYTCTNCHNTQRENPDLPVQNPDARVDFIRSGHPQVWLAPATTFWGITDRVAFYNDYYAIYHGLCVPETTTNTQIATGGPDSQGNSAPGTRKMNPYSLEDAMQVCSAYCSVGRYMLRWEMDSVLAYLYDQELHLDDVQLTADERTTILDALVPPSNDVIRVDQARTLLASKYLRQSAATPRGLPSLIENADGSISVATFPDGTTYVGDAARGATIYELSCSHCHGTSINAVQGAELAADLQRYYTALAKGITPPNVAYMPEFMLQRLSNRQSADLQVYLQSLAQ